MRVLLPILLFILSIPVYAQTIIHSSNDKIVILGKDVYFGKFYLFKKAPVKMINMPGGFVLKIDNKYCPIGFTLAERKYIQGFYDVKLEQIEKEGNCITYIGNIPERKVIKDLMIGQIVLKYCELDNNFDCDRGVVTWELYYFPGEDK